MRNSKTDFVILTKIIRFCDTIDEANNDYNAIIDTLEQKPVYKSAITMCITQIGELANKLSEDFKNTYNEISWKNIRLIRNSIVHGYDEFDNEVLWDTITEDIPRLKNYCIDILKQTQLQR